MCRCKRNIEEEEAAAEAKVRSLVPEDTPHPSLYGIQPPSPEILIHVQGTAGGAEVTILILLSVICYAIGCNSDFRWNYLLRVLLILCNNEKIPCSHVQGSDGPGAAYLEGKQWVKGKLIGTGAFCSCFLARDTRLGTMMAVKQVCPTGKTRQTKFTIAQLLVAVTRI